MKVIKLIVMGLISVLVHMWSAAAIYYCSFPIPGQSSKIAAIVYVIFIVFFVYIASRKETGFSV